MRIQTYEQLLSAYDFPNGGIDPEDMEKRKQLLGAFDFSVIAEGTYSELNALLEWIETNIGKGITDHIFYGKIDYDYGFFELFVQNKANEELLIKNIPLMFALSPDGNFYRTNGDEWTKHDTSMKDAIILDKT